MIMNGNQTMERSSPPPLCSSQPQETSGLADMSGTAKGTGEMDPRIDIERRRHSQPLPQTYSRSRAARQASRSSTNPPSASPEGPAPGTSILIKREPVSDDTAIRHHRPPPNTTARRNSDSNLEESTAGASSSSKGYQIGALIDIPPMAAPLNRASRTSSLSSSLSSFRFGGSLSQLWASQISLSGKINNMKSTG